MSFQSFTFIFFLLILNASSAFSNRWQNAKATLNENSLQNFSDCKTAKEFFQKLVVDSPIRVVGFNSKFSGVNLSKLGLGVGKVLDTSSNSAIRTNFRDSAGGSGGGSGSGGFGGAGIGSEASRAKSAAGPTHSTQTNNQIASVDEADFVKTNGKSIFHVVGDKLHISKSWPVNSLNLESTLQFNAVPHDLLLEGGNLIVLLPVEPKHEEVPRFKTVDSKNLVLKVADKSRTEIMVFDVSTPSKPKHMRSVTVDGYYKDARLMNSQIVLLNADQIRVPNSDTYSQAVNAKGTSENNAYRNLVNRMSVKDLFGEDMKDCSHIYANHKTGSLSYTRIAKISLKDFSTRQAMVFASSQIHFISTQNAYLVSYQTGNYSYGGKQVLHKVNLFGKDQRVAYEASGLVDGQINNQFFMDEHKGNLRVVLGERWGQSVKGNKLEVYSQKGNELVKLGGVEAIAPGEDVKSVRFDGDRGYVVTFRKVDPLFVFDLSQPANPKVMGELKIPGFSTYIHPIDNKHLLTIGFNADEQTGRTKGIKLSIFNVSDLKNPVETDSIVAEDDTSSSATHSHHAFNYFAQQRVLAIPVRPSMKDSKQVGVIH